MTGHYEETTTDSEDRVSTEASTKVIWEDKARIGFQINDDNGTVTVMPGGATLEETATVNRYAVFAPAGAPPSQLPDEHHFGGMNIPLGMQPGDRNTYQETAIAVGSRLYVLGEARIMDNQLAIAKPSAPFLIAVKSEEELMKEREQNNTNALVGMVVGSMLGLICLLVGLSGR
ncbi:MAG: GIDE domain-containing protein [Pseudanabaenaceae cyanobacterium]